MAIRIDSGGRRYTTNLHDAAVRVSRGEATCVTDADRKAVEEYTKGAKLPDGKSIAEKKKKTQQRQNAIKGLADWAKSEEGQRTPPKKEK